MRFLMIRSLSSIAVAALLLCSNSPAQANDKASPSTAPPFSVEDLQGNQLQLVAESSDELTVICFLGHRVSAGQTVWRSTSKDLQCSFSDRGCPIHRPQQQPARFFG